MSQVIKRRCCNSFAIALALVWSVLFAYKAIDYVQNAGGEAPSSISTVAANGSFYP